MNPYNKMNSYAYPPQRMLADEPQYSNYTSPASAPLPLSCKGSAIGNASFIGLVWQLTSPQRKLAWMEACVLMAAVMGFFMQLLGSYRRRTNSWLLRNLLWASYISAVSLMSYITGLMHNSSFRIDLFPIWALMTTCLLLSPGNINAFTLADTDNQKRFAWAYVVQSFWLGGILSSAAFELQPCLWLLWFFLSSKIDERAAAFKYTSLSASSGVAETTRKIADYMAKEDWLRISDEPEPADPTSMRGYKYLVGVKDAKGDFTPPSYLLEFDKDKIVTTEDIWECQGILSSAGGDKDGKLKDICLSFALFWMLLRRYAGYPLHECRLEKTWRFVRDGLFKKGHARAFRVIEVELEFLFDYFYTKSYAIYVRGPLKKSFQLGMVVLYFWIALGTLSHFPGIVNDPNIWIKCKLDVNLTITRALILFMTALELLHFLAILTSNWSKVFFLCGYVQMKRKSSSWFHGLRQTMTKMICRTGSPWVKPWARKLGQYNLLKSYNHVPMKWFRALLGEMIDYARNGQKRSKDAKLSEKVKEAIGLCIQRIDWPCRLSDGSASLQLNGAADLCWACQLETHTHVILVWHIATSLCEIEDRRGPHLGAANFKVATSLSKYCAYLVAFAPRLLPDHPNITDTIFDQVVGLATGVLKGTVTNGSKYDKLMKLDTTNAVASGNILQRGAMLGQQLIVGIEDERQRWKVLAYFWAELMVFLAPSDNVRAHADYLAQGGEFITHIWALLTHAGIVKRDDVVSPAP